MSPKVSKKPTSLNRRIVISTISVLYLLCFADFIVEWYYLDWVVVINGDTRESIFWGSVGEGPQWIFVLNDFLQISSFIVADGLLVDLEMLPRLGTIFLGDFGSIDTFSRGMRLFDRIVVMIIESAAAYTLILLFETILFVIPSINTVESIWSEVIYYTQAVLNVIANQGMAPTVLVARIALTNPDITIASATVTHISGLQFGPQHGSGGGHSENTTGGDINASVYVDNADPTPVIEVKRDSSAEAPFGDNKV
ncbi:hypothetical protein CVT25_014718 [Psilocybe cyanescens]|uniref:Uncharacterized protein n=1 Tax=Psilocybe cyanescens TaxID=93625 RepID=A0A409WR58_PSICY|nr:hypothetical protein CVT25_014718 [Psilocybe cyanescens]